MRKLIALLLAVAALMCLYPALAEEEADIAHMRQVCEAALADLLKEADGWEKLMLEKAQITTIERDGKRLRATVVMPKLQSGVSTKEKAKDGAEAYLQKAVAPYAAQDEQWDVSLLASVKQGKDGAWTVKWTSTNVKKLKSTLSSQAKKARQSFVTGEMEKALNLVLFPDGADMPSRKPKKTVPEVGLLEDYAAQVAQELGVTQEQAARRLPVLMLLMNVTKITAADGLENAVLSVTVKNWKGMLDAALKNAKGKLDGMIGVPEMNRDELEQVFCDQLPRALLDSYYSKKGQTTEQLTVDMTALASDGPKAAKGVMDFYCEYMEAVEKDIDKLADYAQTLSYYPRVPLIDTAILKGKSVEGGAGVSFDMGEDEINHGYVCVKQDGKTVLEGFIRNGVKLLVRMQPGAYQVYCTIGPEWFGEEYLFGKDAYFGVFDMPVEEGQKTVVHMQDVDGNLPVTDLTEEQFRDAVK